MSVIVVCLAGAFFPFFDPIASEPSEREGDVGESRRDVSRAGRVGKSLKSLGFGSDIIELPVLGDLLEGHQNPREKEPTKRSTM